MYQKDWVVYCKPPFKKPSCVISYLGRYTHRVAISNNRILKLEDGNVTFKWRDYRDGKKEKIMTIKAGEFIRRFLLHILPERFTKIRHYGLLCSKDKTVRLNFCKRLTRTPVNSQPKEKASPLQLLKKLTGRDFTLCPCCSIGHLSRAAPAWWSQNWTLYLKMPGFGEGEAVSILTCKCLASRYFPHTCPVRAAAVSFNGIIQNQAQYVLIYSSESYFRLWAFFAPDFA